MIAPDSWVVIHTTDQPIADWLDGTAGHAFGPFTSLERLEAFEAGREDRCFKHSIPMFDPLGQSNIVQAIDELTILGSLFMNWMGLHHGLTLGHDDYCHLDGRDVGDADLCHCGWSSLYAKYLQLSNETVQPGPAR